jgi:hypothetical protein
MIGMGGNADKDSPAYVHSQNERERSMHETRHEQGMRLRENIRAQTTHRPDTFLSQHVHRPMSPLHPQPASISPYPCITPVPTHSGVNLTPVTSLASTMDTSGASALEGIADGEMVSGDAGGSVLRFMVESFMSLS